MNKLLTIFLTLAFVCTGCESKRITVETDMEIEETLTVDKTGEIHEYMSIDSLDVKDALDIPSDALVDEVNIEAINIKLVMLNGNEADFVRISGSQQVEDYWFALFDPYKVPLMAVDSPLFGINTLIAAGVATIKTKLEGYLKRAAGVKPINLLLIGESIPAGKRIHGDIIIQVKGSVTYHKCLELPWFMGGDKCQ